MLTIDRMSHFEVPSGKIKHTGNLPVQVEMNGFILFNRHNGEVIEEIPLRAGDSLLSLVVGLTNLSLAYLQRKYRRIAG